MRLKRMALGAALSALALLPAVPALAAADTQPQSRKDWMKAAWSLMATHRALPADIPDRAGRYEVVVALRVRRDGTVSTAELVRSSGLPSLDNSVLKMVLLSAPFPPLPPDMRENELLAMPVAFSFDQPEGQERSVIDAKSLFESRKLMDKRRAENRL